MGAVVMNRMRSGSYPNSIQGVISQPGQFGPAATGQVASIMANGPKSSCMQAAQAAINGETVIGNLTHFKRAGSTDGIVIGTPRILLKKSEVTGYEDLSLLSVS